MSARQYRVKPADVEAIQWNLENLDALLNQLTAWNVLFELEVRRTNEGISDASLTLTTVHGEKYMTHGDWIIRDDDRQIQRVTEAQFADKYEPKENPS